MTIVKTSDLKVGDIIRSPHFVRAIRDFNDSPARIVSEKDFRSFCAYEDDFAPDQTAATRLYVVYSVGQHVPGHYYEHHAAHIRLPCRQNHIADLIDTDDWIAFGETNVPEVERVGRLVMEPVMDAH